MLFDFQNGSFLALFIIALMFQYKEDVEVPVVGGVTAPVQIGEECTSLSSRSSIVSATRGSLQQQHRDRACMLWVVVETAVSGTSFYDLDPKVLLPSPRLN